MLAHGIDLVEISRFTEFLGRHPDRARDRLFTKAELEYAVGKKRETEHLAVRFAAKEAVLKALGTGWAQGIAWTDVEVTRDEAGRPGVALHRRAAQLAAERGIVSWLVSLSHTEQYAMASVIAVGEV
ncbi:Holo-[acyl-carrier-protein] synthase [hydrothermal vent metagenome]|uniref:Holo-[acyl-carrier-protein] synthase n=1 Tax=hydrothermal vent metagenome TaxID=652676 RepID=A0A3B1DPJ5_9ZZZZ